MGEELRREFLAETVRHLSDLQTELPGYPADELPRDFLQSFFRRLHTIKGTAQTLGADSLARFAHETEHLLQALNTGAIHQNARTTALIAESLIHLLAFSRNRDYEISNDFLERLHHAAPADETFDRRLALTGKIPQSLLSLLTATETEALKSAILRRQKFYLIEAFFGFAVFSAEFVRLREILSAHGEIIAVSPSGRAAAGEIGFQIFYAAKRRRDEVAKSIEAFNTHIDFTTDSEDEKPDGLTNLLLKIKADSERKARILDKKINFEISGDAEGIDRKNILLINYASLHLLRNAIDHAIELPAERLANGKPAHGTIKISILAEDDRIVLKIEDDGSGIDAEKIRAHARRRGILRDGENPGEQATFELIFAHGFSTSETVSEISGRGVGLDIVRDLVEKAAGKISVRTEKNRGTTFEISLPA